LKRKKNGDYAARLKYSVCICMYIYRVKNVFLRCPTPRLHCFLFSHWPSLRFLSVCIFVE